MGDVIHHDFKPVRQAPNEELDIVTEVLVDALNENLIDVVVIGLDEQGAVYIDGTLSDLATAVYLERAKNHILAGLIENQDTGK
jgi:hypothetical protein